MNHSQSPSILYPKKVDLNNCDKEPIHLIGKVQSHTYLFAFDKISYQLKYASQNYASILGNDSLLDEQSSITKIFPTLVDQISDIKNTSKKKKFVFYVEKNSSSLLGMVHLNSNLLVVELEPFSGKIDFLQHQEFLSEFMEEISNQDALESMSNLAATKIKAYTNYDRVMIYKFDADWNGEIIAESKEAHLISWLNWHYPATDIPQQARELFLKQGTRVIADVPSSAVPIQKYDKEAEILDLSSAEGRSVSPMHIEYLKNMGVGATMTIAIVHNNQLWGLVACHHYSAKFVGYYERNACEFIGKLLATHLGHQESNRLLHLAKLSNITRSKLIDKVSDDWDLVQLTKSPKMNLLNLTNATGAVLYYNGIARSNGEVPNDVFIIKLLEKVKSISTENTFYTDHLKAFFPEAIEVKDVASGVLIVFFGKDRKDAIIWFKKEVLKQINWGGNPEKIKVLASGDLTPRTSFEKWSESKSEYSEPWLDYEIAAANALREHISEIIIQKFDGIQKLNDNLKKAYAELETFSYSVSHDLRSPLRGIDGFTQILKEDYYDSLDAFGKQAINTIIESVNKMNMLIDDILSFSGLGKIKAQKSEVDFNKLTKRVLEFQQAKLLFPNTIIHIGELPVLIGDEAMLFQLLNNLIGNALKYSADEENPEISINYDNNIFSITDNGIGFDQHHDKKIFNIFNRLVGDEYHGSGVGLAIAQRVIEKHEGKLWVNSKLNVGSSFYFSI